jgi:hypothetical protein
LRDDHLQSSKSLDPVIARHIVPAISGEANLILASRIVRQVAREIVKSGAAALRRAWFMQAERQDHMTAAFPGAAALLLLRGLARFCSAQLLFLPAADFQFGYVATACEPQHQVIHRLTWRR